MPGQERVIELCLPQHALPLAHLLWVAHAAHHRRLGLQLMHHLVWKAQLCPLDAICCETTETNED